MDRHTIIFTADKRLSDLGTLLTGKRVLCSWDEYLRKTADEGNAELVFVFPIPVNKLENYQQMKKRLMEEMQSRNVRCVFGGLFDESWCSFFAEHQIPYVDFMNLAEFVKKNSEITAEAVIAETLQLSSFSIQEQKICVTGFGACARPIAKKMQGLGADVTIAARSEKDRRKAKESGFLSCDFKTLEKEIGNFTTVINTVPALVITEEMIRKMQKETVVLDIASKPGGTDFVCAKERGIATKLALSLPGIYSTGSSAALLQKAMWENAPLQNLKRGEQSWIFQIII